MQSIAGIFESRQAAERAAKSLNLPDDRVSVIAPQPRQQEDEDIGQALGGVMGGSLGLAVGTSAGMAAAALVIPGVGPVIATGIMAGLLLGAGGFAAGAAAGKKLDEMNAPDPAHDPYDRFFYHEALRRGRAIVLALADSEQEGHAIRASLAASGATNVDAMREAWWKELREQERAAYQGNFEEDENDYQRGFEAALEPTRRGQPLEEDTKESDAFRKGYERGRKYFEKIYGDSLMKSPAA